MFVKPNFKPIDFSSFVKGAITALMACGIYLYWHFQHGEKQDNAKIIRETIERKDIEAKEGAKNWVDSNRVHDWTDDELIDYIRTGKQPESRGTR